MAFVDFFLFLYLVIIMSTSCSEAKTRNVALRKPSDQSNRADNSMLANDGDVNGDYHRGSCTHTLLTGEKDPWWKVNLGARYLVKYIAVYNRVDCCGDRLHDVHFHVSNSSGKPYKTFRVRSGRMPRYEAVFTENREPMAAEWVRIILYGSYRILTLCEVKVMAEYRIVQVAVDVNPKPDMVPTPDIIITVGSVKLAMDQVIKGILHYDGVNEPFAMTLNEATKSSPYLEIIFKLK